VKQRDEPPLQLGLEVDEDVPAEDEVHAGERRIPRHVLLREHHRLADLPVHPERAVVLLHEEPAEPRRAHVRGDVGGVLAAARPREVAFFPNSDGQVKPSTPQTVRTTAEGLVIDSAPGWRFTEGDKPAIGKDVDGVLVNSNQVGPYSEGENPMALFREKLDAAAAEGSAAVMLISQANPGWDQSDATRAPVRDPRTLAEAVAVTDGFKEFLLALRDEVIRFRKPVAYVHGDSHYYRVDRPFQDAAGRRLVPVGLLLAGELRRDRGCRRLRAGHARERGERHGRGARRAGGRGDAHQHGERERDRDGPGPRPRGGSAVRTGPQGA